MVSPVKDTTYLDVFLKDELGLIEKSMGRKNRYIEAKLFAPPLQGRFSQYSKW